MKKLCWLIIGLCFSITPVKAYYCSYENLSYYKKLASNINISYDYIEADDGVTFTTTILNLQPNLYIVDLTNHRRYDYTNNEIVISGYQNGQTIQYAVYSTDINCNDEILRTIRLTMPTYNRYYKDPLCEGLSEYNLCNRWSSHGLGYETFVQKVTQYKENLNNQEQPKPTPEEIPDNSIVQWIIRFAKQYYYIFLILIIIASSIGIYKINKKDSMYY